MMPSIRKERRRFGQATPPEGEEYEELEVEELAAEPRECPIRVTVVMLSGEELFSDDLDPGLTIREFKSRMRELIGRPGSVKLVCGTEVLQPDDAKLRTSIGHVSPATVTLIQCAPMTGRFKHLWECGTCRDLHKRWYVDVSEDGGKFDERARRMEVRRHGSRGPIQNDDGSRLKGELESYRPAFCEDDASYMKLVSMVDAAADVRFFDHSTHVYRGSDRGFCAVVDGTFVELDYNSDHE
jgi:hypothetical protein